MPKPAHTPADAAAVTIPLNSATLKLVAKYWHVLVSLLLCAVSAGVGKSTFSSMGNRLDALESAKPDVTRSIAERNTGELAGVRADLGRIHEDVAAVRVDVGRLCTYFALQPIRGVEGSGGQWATEGPIAAQRGRTSDRRGQKWDSGGEVGSSREVPPPRAAK